MIGNAGVSRFGEYVFAIAHVICTSTSYGSEFPRKFAAAVSRSTRDARTRVAKQCALHKTAVQRWAKSARRYLSTEQIPQISLDKIRVLN